MTKEKKPAKPAKKGAGKALPKPKTGSKPAPRPEDQERPKAPDPIRTMQDLRNAWDWGSPAAVQFFANCGRSHTTLTQAAHILGYHPETLIAEYSRRPALQNAYQEQKVGTTRRVVDALIRNALGGDVKAQMFFLRNRDPENFKDTQHHDVKNRQIFIEIGQDESGL